MDYFTNRHTIRRYTDRDISPELLTEIIDAACHAPTTGNMQLYSVVVTTAEDMKERLAAPHFNQPQVRQAPVVLTVCADFNRFVRWCRARGADPGYDNLESLVTACLDACIFAQQICTIAELKGLGCCYLGTTTYNPDQIARILQLPKRVIPLVTLTLGYPAEDGEDCGRLPVEAVMHQEVYHDYSDADIDRLYAKKEARDDSKAFVAENGKDSLAQVFTDIRYTRQANETFSKVLAEYIKQNYPFE